MSDVRPPDRYGLHWHNRQQRRADPVEQCSSPLMRSEDWDGADAERAFSGGAPSVPALSIFMQRRQPE